MDRTEDYRTIVRKVIEEYARYKPSNGQIEAEAVVDRDHDHYEVMHVGWDGARRVHGCVIHIDIRGGKSRSSTTARRPVAEELLAAGIPREDIVLGFHPAILHAARSETSSNSWKSRVISDANFSAWVVGTRSNTS